ncbi:hypothetical protein [Rubinisphaera margarita]|uniref:hypothetical protein n=1 Tax=Rubinisphaera margarita TaxID=2909586 RepID=UPI001EE9A531|nr:hypothetical protein [Rubinisphaera margarita]MCG6158328.1 hypothetical protein [Rubinisphaera margarita]
MDLPSWLSFVGYDLDHLKHSTTLLETDPGDYIAVKIRKLRFKCKGTRRSIVLQIDDTDEYDSIHTMIDEYLHPEHAEMDDLFVDHATIRFEFQTHESRKTGRISVDIGYPNSCNFRNTHQEWEELIRKYLSRWRIARAQCADNDSETVGSEATLSAW